MLQINNCRVVGFVVVWIYFFFFKKQKPWKDSWWGIACLSSLCWESRQMLFHLLTFKKQSEATAGIGKVWSQGKSKKEKQVQNKTWQTAHYGCIVLLGWVHLTGKKGVLCGELHGFGTSVFIIYTNLNHACGFFSAEGNT